MIRRLSPRQVISTALVAALLGGLLVLAVRADGNTIPDLDLHDAGIWVTNTSNGRIGRTNIEIAAVDAALNAASTHFDVLQSGATTLLRRYGQPSDLVGVDPVRGELLGGPELPADAVVALGGRTAALFDPGTGAFLVTAAESSSAATNLDPVNGQPVHTLDEGGALAVGLDGTAHLLDRSTGELTSWTAAGEQVGVLTIEGDVEEAMVSAVGDRPVVLTGDGRVVVGGGSTVSVEDFGDDPQLQQPGPATDHVLVATDGRLLRVPLDEGVPEVLHETDSMMATRPVQLGGCAYSAWKTDASYVRICDGIEPLEGSEPGLQGGDLEWRVNRDRITLNDLTEGTQLLFVEDAVVFLDGEWTEALQLDADEEETENDEDTEAESAEEECTEPGAPNDPPVLTEDALRTRDGQPLVVYPLRNDTDANCDTLLIEAVEPADPAAGHLIDIVDDRRAVQVRHAPGARQVVFGYTVSDGKDGPPGRSRVTVDVVGQQENEPPDPGPRQRTTAVTGGLVTHDVLATALDPDGDVLRLKSVTSDATVQFSPRGEITFNAPPVTGEVEVTYVLSDGREDVAGVLTVKVVDRNQNLPPDARNDSAATLVGRAAVVDVLANDSDPNGEQLRVISAEPLGSGDVEIDYEPGSPFIRVRTDRPGTANIIYQVTDGRGPASAVLRVDFREPVAQQPPVAVRDEVFLTAGVPAFVPVLDNDTDPNGEVLIVTGIEDLPPDAPIAVSVVQRSILKISTPTELAAPVTFRYRITDGGTEDTGVVLVEPATVFDTNRPPVVRPDEFTVRAGGIAVLPVLDNDSDPEGDALVIEAPEEVDAEAAAQTGRLFLTDGQLRYEAPAEPKGTIELDYDVLDGAGNNASGRLFLHVLAADSERNRPPHAPELVERTVAGGTVRLEVPLSILDPDGDQVRLVSLGGTTKHGTATIDDDGATISYTADSAGHGTDELTYRVRDIHADTADEREATGTILIGVAPRPTFNSPPVVVDDEVIVERGATVVIDVLANDSDPDFDELAISTSEIDRPVAEHGEVTIADDSLRYVAPAAEVTDATRESFLYTAHDGRGLARAARVTVIFRTDEVNHPPTLRDHVLDPQEPGTLVRIPVLDGADDPDGDPLRLIDTSFPGGTVSGGVVELTVPERPVQFTYLVTDDRPISPDDDTLATARGAVFIPVLAADEDLPPVVEPIGGVEVEAGQSVNIPVLRGATDPEGSEVHLFGAIEGSARHGTAALSGDGRQIVFTATDPDYVGDAGFTFEVGDKADIATANITTATVQITIFGSAQTPNTPPSISALSVEVPAGGERTVDLAAAATDPDPDQTLSFDMVESGGGDGVQASLAGSVLTVTASDDAATGSRDPVTVSVSDGEDEATGTVTVLVSSSEKPLAVLGPDEEETLQNQPVTIDVLSNDVNPFPGTPLTIVSVSEPSDGGTARTDGGGSITYTPADGFFGTSTFTYRVADRTGDPTREQETTVTVTVIGKPDAPAAPACVGGESEVVRVQWAAPNANGAPITEYRVEITSEEGTREETFDNSTVQTIGELTNGVSYRFSVAAVNEAVTDSNEPNYSAQSPVCVPDERPGQPEPPVTEFGEEQLEITWTEPENNGSAITSYILTNTTTGQSQTFGPSTFAYTWTGLTNGTSYQFTVTAVNALGEGLPSGLSTGDSIPAGLPEQPAKPDVPQTVGDRDRFLLVTWEWSPSQDNGDAVKAWRVTSYKDGAEDQVIVLNDGGARDHRFDTENGVDYTFTVETENKAGWSAPSPPSDPKVSAAPPLAPAAPNATEGDRETVLTYTPPDDNGSEITSYEYSTNGGAWTSLPSGGRITGLTNGTDYRFKIRALNADGDGQPSPDSNRINPYGRPATPSVSSSVNDRTITWNWSQPSGNGRSIVRYEIRLDGGAWTSNGTSRSYNRSFGYSETHTLYVRAVTDGADPARRTGGDGSSTGRTVDPPPDPTAHAENTGSYTRCTEGSSSPTGCEWKRLRVEGFPPNQVFSIECEFSDNTTYNFGVRITTDGAGRGTQDRACHAGGGYSLTFHVFGNGVDERSNSIAGRSG